MKSQWEMDRYLDTNWTWRDGRRVTLRQAREGDEAVAEFWRQARWCAVCLVVAPFVAMFVVAML